MRLNQPLIKKNKFGAAEIVVIFAFDAHFRDNPLLERALRTPGTLVECGISHTDQISTPERWRNGVAITVFARPA